MDRRLPLSDYLAMAYEIEVIPDAEGGYTVLFPELPGCMTQVEASAGIPAAAQEIRTLWIETQYEDGFDIPLPVRLRA